MPKSTRPVLRNFDSFQRKLKSDDLIITKWEQVGSNLWETNGVQKGPEGSDILHKRDSFPLQSRVTDEHLQVLQKKNGFTKISCQF